MPRKIRKSDVFKHLGQRIKSAVSRDFMTYLVFLLIAIVIWLLNALNKDYTTDLKMAVKYTDLPEDKVLVSSPPDHLTLTVKAQGFTLLKYRLGSVVVEENYQTLRRNNKKTGAYFIATQTIFDKVAAQLSPTVTLKLIAPDTLHFQFSETIRKDVPVKALLQMKFEKGFLPKGQMLVVPESISVVGPQTIIDTMKYVYTRAKSFKNLNDTLRTDINLEPVNQLRYSATEVKIVQIIERHTEATIVVPIEPIGLPEGLTMKTFPGSVTVSCMVPIVDFEKLQPYMFRAVVDYATVKDVKDKQAKVKVSLVRSPDYISDVKINPKNVDFIIEK